MPGCVLPGCAVCALPICCAAPSAAHCFGVGSSDLSISSPQPARPLARRSQSPSVGSTRRTPLLSRTCATAQPRRYASAIVKPGTGHAASSSVCSHMRLRHRCRRVAPPTLLLGGEGRGREGGGEWYALREGQMLLINSTRNALARITSAGHMTTSSCSRSAFATNRQKAVVHSCFAACPRIQCSGRLQLGTDRLMRTRLVLLHARGPRQ